MCGDLGFERQPKDDPKYTRGSLGYIRVREFTKFNAHGGNTHDVRGMRTVAHPLNYLDPCEGWGGSPD